MTPKQARQAIERIDRYNAIQESMRKLKGVEIARTIRAELGLSVRELAKQMNEHASNISSIETGNRIPSVRWLRKLLDAEPLDR